MPEALVTATFSHTSLDTKNDVVNTFAFETTPETPVTAGPDLALMIAAFYNAAQSTGLRVGEFLSPGLSRGAGAVALRVYNITGNLDGSPHGSPVYEDSMTLTPVSASGPTPLPEEVAAAVTLRAFGWDNQPVEAADGADAGSLLDRPRQRYTGKLYLGPLIYEANAPADNVARIRATFITTILDACQDLRDAAEALGYEWSVWSRADSTLRRIDFAQVDNEFDTQRRRGVQSSTRTTRDLTA